MNENAGFVAAAAYLGTTTVAGTCLTTIGSWYDLRAAALASVAIGPTSGIAQQLETDANAFGGASGVGVNLRAAAIAARANNRTAMTAAVAAAQAAAASPGAAFGESRGTTFTDPAPSGGFGHSTNGS